MQKFFIRKNDKNIEVNKTKGDDRLPYFSIFLIKDSGVEGQKAEFIEIGAAWKSKTGKGYNLRLSEGVVMDITNKKSYTKGQTNGD